MARPKPTEPLIAHTFRLSQSEMDGLRRYAEARGIPLNTAGREVIARAYDWKASR